MGQNFHFADISIIFLYIAICLFIGFWKLKPLNSIKDFSLGKSYFSTFPLAATFFATYIGAFSTIGNITNTHVIGILFVSIIMLGPLIWVIKAQIFTKRLYRFKDCLSVSDIMEKLYGTPGKWLTNIASIFLTISVIILQIWLGSDLFILFFGKLNFFNPLLISLVVLIAYVVFGGFGSVVLTDIFQFIVFFIILPIISIYTFKEIGGYELFLDKYHHKEFHFSLNQENLITFISFICLKFICISNPAFIQRILACKDSHRLKRSLLMCGVFSIPFTGIVIFMAFMIKLYSNGVSTDQAFLNYIQVLPIGIKGAFLVSMLAIIMSTIDSWVHYASILFSYDMCKKILPKISAKTLLSIAKIFTIFLGFCIAISMLDKQDNWSIIWYGYNIWGPVILVPLVSGFLGFQTSKKVFCLSSLIAIIAVLCTAYLDHRFYIFSLFAGILTSFISFFGIHYIYILKTSNKGIIYNFFTDTINFIKFISVRNIFNLIKLLLKNILLDAKDNLEKNQEQIYTFSIFAIFYYLVPLFVEGIGLQGSYSAIFYFRAFASLLCILLCFNEYWPVRFRQNYLPAYWIFTLFFCLSFLPSYATFYTDGKTFWLFNVVISTFLLAVLVNWETFMFIFFFGLISSYVIDDVTVGDPMDIPRHKLYLIAYIYMLITVIGVIFFRSKNKEQKEKLSIIRLFSGAIAHEVKSPIAAIYMLMQAFSDIGKDVITKVQKSNNKDKEHISFSLNEFEYAILTKELHTGLNNSVKRAENTIESVLLPIRANVQHDLKQYSMAKVIELSLKEYGLTDKQKEKLTLDTKANFYFFGSENFIKHVILNLIKNAYKHGGEEIDIEISLKNNKLYFRDNGKGIDKNILPHIFNKFFTASQSGTGIGLAFCKTIMESIGGSISCNSKLDKYTEFVLVFPNN